MNRTLIACIPHNYTANKGWQTRHARNAVNKLDRLHRLTTVMHGDRQVFWALTWRAEEQFTFVHCYVISNCREDALHHFMDMLNGSEISCELLTDAPSDVVESTHA